MNKASARTNPNVLPRAINRLLTKGCMG
jgi:hypothetical protein